MAAGDITFDKPPGTTTGGYPSQLPRNGGDHTIVTGVIEADTTARTFVIAGGGTGTASRYLLYCNLVCTTSAATADVQCSINTTSDMATAALGSIGVDAEAADSFRFTAGVI